MSNQEAPFSYTTKIGNDLLTVRGDDFKAFLENLTSLYLVPSVKHLIEVIEGSAVATVTASLGGTVTSAPSAPDFQPVPPPTVATPAPVVAGSRSCQHGVMLQKTGQSAKGEWRAFFCPTPKGTPDQCQAIFAKRGTPEWDSFAAF